ncbi:MAG TPA: ATP-binding cassette domain-containing protein [Streptosporangiaceae bacterium]|nr:ATP-binding cassette domain-containing protein [Streptosporangiaceae bacterium]
MTPHPPLIELSGLLIRAGRRDGADAPPKPIDLVVARGEMVMLTGQCRSGRSGLLNVLGLLDRPAAGSYLLNGVDVAKLRDRERAALRGRQIGLVFQRKMVLPTRSVLDNVMLPLRYLGLPRWRRIDAAAQTLDRVGLATMAHLMAWQLSAGELALCAIGRALVARPSLVLCDEPTAGLDQPAAAQVIGVLANVHREGRTVVVATADQLAAAYSGRSVRLGEPASPLDFGVRLPITDTQAGSLR